MAPPKLVGVLVDQYGNEADVWYSPDEHHVVIMIGDSQDGDFVVNEPCLLDPQQVKAHAAYQSWRLTGSVARIYLQSHSDFAVDEFDVIEPFSSNVARLRGST